MTIPASAIVAVSPGVLTAGGSSFALNGLLLTTSARVPTGTVLSLPDAPSVGDYFGASSAEKDAADTYFLGYENSTRTPGAMLFAQYNRVAVAAFLRGGDISALTLAQLQAIAGSLTLTFEGFARVDADINLSAATSFSSAAGIIQSQINAGLPAGAAFTGSIASTVLTVASGLTGTVAVGQTVAGGATAANTIITSQIAGTPGGLGTYRVSISQTVGSGSLTSAATPVAVTYDSVSGGFLITSGVTGAISTVIFPTGTLTTPIKLTAATGAVLSQGAAAAAPQTFMDALIVVSQNWAFFTTMFNPDDTGNVNKLEFATWANQQDDRYGYVPWDTDEAPVASAPASISLGREIIDQKIADVSVIWDSEGGQKAFFVLGALASINFDELNGRTNMMFRRQSGITPDVLTAAAKANLTANGYSFYGGYATANDAFSFLTNAFVSGDFRWLDSFANQIWMKDGFQVALMTFLQAAKLVPYNAAGRAAIEAALNDRIQAAVDFGAIQVGVPLSSLQKSQLNRDTGGIDISGTLTARGWYLQVLPATAEVRAARGSPPMKFWYMDGGSVQRIEMASIAVQ